MNGVTYVSPSGTALMRLSSITNTEEGACGRFLRSQKTARPATATAPTPPTTPPAMAPEFDEELWVSAGEGWVAGLVVRVVVTLVVGVGVALVVPFINVPGPNSAASGSQT